MMAYAFFSKCPKIEDVHFLFQNQMGKMGHFKKKSSIKKWGISKKKHVINSKAENEPKKKSELISDLIPKKNEKSKFSKNF